MSFEFRKTELNGLIVIQPHMYPDDRGLYKKNYEKNILSKISELDYSIDDLEFKLEIDWDKEG